MTTSDSPAGARPREAHVIHTGQSTDRDRAVFALLAVADIPAEQLTHADQLAFYRAVLALDAVRRMHAIGVDRSVIAVPAIPYSDRKTTTLKPGDVL